MLVELHQWTTKQKLNKQQSKGRRKNRAGSKRREIKYRRGKLLELKILYIFISFMATDYPLTT